VKSAYPMAGSYSKKFYALYRRSRSEILQHNASRHHASHEMFTLRCQTDRFPLERTAADILLYNRNALSFFTITASRGF